MNEKIFENDKIFQYQEINESQDITNHTAINLFTEKTCLCDISDFRILGQQEVKAVNLLLSKLPPEECQYCILSKPPKDVGESSECFCDCLFLCSVDPAKWRHADNVWFVRSKWSREKLSGITAMVSKEVGTKKSYKNGSIRPTNLTRYP